MKIRIPGRGPITIYSNSAVFISVPGEDSIELYKPENPHPKNDLLMETGDWLLMESGDSFLMEA